MGAKNLFVEHAVDEPRARFEAAFDAHYVEVLAFALRRVHGRPAAEDAAAETFTVAWRRRDSIPEEPLLWLYAVARRVIANQHRSRTRRVRLRERLLREPARPAVLDPADVVEARDGIAAAFARLSEADREVLRLVAWEGLGTEAGAEVLGCSPIAFRMRLHRARRQLERSLELANDPGFVETTSPCAARTAEEA